MAKTTKSTTKNVTEKQPLAPLQEDPARRPPLEGDVSDEVLTLILDDLRTIQDVFGSDVILTAKERRRMIGSGIKNYGFLDKAFDVALAFPDLAHFIDMTNYGRNIKNIENDRTILIAIDSLRQYVNDHLLVSGDEAYRDAIAFYNQIKILARQGNTDAIAAFSRLKPFFSRPRRRKVEPTVAEVIRDVKALEHGTKEGKIVIENEEPLISAGKHAVIDQTHRRREIGKFEEKGEIEE